LCTLLIAAGADPEFTADSVNRFTALHQAALNNFPDALEALLAAGAQTDPPSNSGSPLHLASQEGHLKVIELLAAAGANLELEDQDGDHPIHLACLGHSSQGDTEAVRLLLKLGADPRARRRRGRTPAGTVPNTNQELKELLLAAEVAFDDSQAARMREAQLKLRATSNANTEREKAKRDSLLAAKRRALAPLQAQANKRARIEKKDKPAKKLTKAPKLAKAAAPKETTPKKVIAKAGAEKVEGYPGWESRATADGRRFYVELSTNEIHWTHPSENPAVAAQPTEASSSEGAAVLAAKVETHQEETWPFAQQDLPQEEAAVAKVAARELLEPAESVAPPETDPKKTCLWQAVFDCGAGGQESATISDIVAAATKLSGGQAFE